MTDNKENIAEAVSTCQFLLLSTPACHLCEEALSLLQDLHAQLISLASESGFSIDNNALFFIEEVDVAEDSGMIEQYGQRIPVLISPDKKVELNWPFDIQQAYEFIYPYIAASHAVHRTE
ncbi:MAG: glutaredoxin family protein [Oleiphilus sp.]